MTVSEIVADRLRISEGFRSKPYKDTTGHLTIGYGTNLDAGLSKEEAELLLQFRLEKARLFLNAALPWWKDLDVTRGSVLLDMCYNLGGPKLMKFKATLKAVQEGRWEDAKKGMLNSLWANQVGDRAVKLANMMLTGKLNEET